MTQTRSGWGDHTRLASRLKDRIAIEAVTETGDGQGGVLRSWNVHARCFAEVEPLPFDGSERMDAAQPVMRLSYRITVRARPDITSRMRVAWKGKLLNIRVVIPGNATTELLADEGVAI